MKLSRTHLFIALSSLALIVVLMIQVNWIIKTARIKEALFNEKANMVLARTAEALFSYKRTRTEAGMTIPVGNHEVRKIDSLLKYYMKFYNFQISYYFELKPEPVPQSQVPGALARYPPEQPGCYQKNLEQESSLHGSELKLVFPDKDQFIFEEMGIPFISTVALILVVLILFWRTVLSLLHQKKISEHTTDFLNNMTHEFKTPLTNIALAGKMMTKEANVTQADKIKHYSAIILEENEKLRLQVEQVLSMTALERGEIPVQKTELDIHALIVDCAKGIGIQIENRQGNLLLSLEAERFVVMGDKTHLSNVLRNLLDNAIKYSPGKPELLIRTFNSWQSLVMVITDKGIGIDAEYHEKVFDKFFRVPTGNVHDVKGFGLGLAYVKKIVELHGGSIELKSEKGKGTSFTINLPNA